MRITLHLDGDNFNCQCSDHSNIADKQDCKCVAGILSLSDTKWANARSKAVLISSREMLGVPNTIADNAANYSMYTRAQSEL